MICPRILSVPRCEQFSELEENCALRGSYNAQGQISVQVLAQNRGYCVYYPSDILQSAWRKFYEQLTVFSLGCFLSSVLCYDWMNKKGFPLFCNNHKTLSHLRSNLKRRIVVVDVRFENWGISLGWCSRISPSFSCGIFYHELRLDQSRTSKTIWWIVTIATRLTANLSKLFTSLDNGKGLYGRFS